MLDIGKNSKIKMLSAKDEARRAGLAQDVFDKAVQGNDGLR